MIEKTLESKILYKGRFLDFVEDQVEIENSGGIVAPRQYFTHPGGVCVIPVLDSEYIVLIKQFRTPVGEIIYEFPAGKKDAGEEPLATAMRELKEETGFTAETWEDKGFIYPCPGYCTEKLHLFLARDLACGEDNPDEGEIVETSIVKLKDAFQMVNDGQIRDAKTICGLFYLSVNN
ncbi:MAG: NUDIX hydrolase [Candidatus Caenarcaniphilales bacterium]|nr:NUDIX hydrolase [Candidatus Caenarcaniphilales bacterium]